MKRCMGACGRQLPASAENFARDPLDRPRPHCRECELAAELAADLADASPPSTGKSRTCRGCDRTLPLDSEHFHHRESSPDGFQSRCKGCINGEHRERRARQRDAAADPLPPPQPSPPKPPLGFCDDPKVRFRMVQQFAERNPRDPTRAARAREIMAAADAEVAALRKPPFDANEVLLMMAEDAEDVDALGTALRYIGWRPEVAAT